MVPAARARLLEEYGKGPEILGDFLKTVPGEAWHFRPAPKEWTAHEIVIHLADTEIQSHVRCRVILAEPGGPLPYYDEKRWTESLGYAQTSREAALSLIGLIRQANLNLLRLLPEEAWQRFALHSTRGRMTLEDWLEGYTAHLLRHIGQIRKNCSLFRKEAG